MYDKAFWAALDALLAACPVVIDRPKGSAHPRFPQCIYPADYGYLRDTSAMDGAGIDLWRGTAGDSLDALICTVDLMKRDAEIKLLLGCTPEEKAAILAFHNDSEYMKGILVAR